MCEETNHLQEIVLKRLNPKASVLHYKEQSINAVNDILTCTNNKGITLRDGLFMFMMCCVMI